MPIEARREQVLDAAQRLILAEGYPAASMEAIAREANLAKPRVYAAYDGRGPLLRALLDRERARVITALADAMPEFTDDGDFDTTLVAAAENLLRAVAAEPDSWRLLQLPTEDAPPQVREHMAAGREFALQRLRDLLDWGIDHGGSLSRLDRELAAQMLLAAGEQAVWLVLAQPADYPPQRFTTFTRTLLRTLST